MRLAILAAIPLLSLNFTAQALANKRVALIIGLMLGGPTEEAFFQSIQIARGSYMVFLDRPVAAGLALFILVTVIVTFKRALSRQRDRHARRSG